MTFAETAHYAGFVAGHSLWMNEATEFLYVFRSVGDACQNGVHVVNLQPRSSLPSPAASARPIRRSRPANAWYMMRAPITTITALAKICFIGSDDNVSIFDVTDKSQPVQVADFTYPGIARAHQGDLTVDLHYWLLGDMMDEHHNGTNTRTFAFDIREPGQSRRVGPFQPWHHGHRPRLAYRQAPGVRGQLASRAAHPEYRQPAGP